MNKRSVYFAGNDTFKQHVIPFFGDAGLEETRDRREADIIYVTYGGHYGPLKHLRSWLGRQSLVFHWIGSDVLRWQEGIRSKNPLKRLYYRSWRWLYRRKHRRGQLVSLAVTPGLKDKLQEVRIPATVFPITSIHRDTIAMADKVARADRPNDVVGYIPLDSFDFYGGPLFTAVARELPHRRFVMVVPDRQVLPDRDRVLADGMATDIPDNVKMLPELSFEAMQRELASARLMLRPTRHDGLALLVLEALLARMHVLWSQPFPHCKHIDVEHITFTELAKQVEAFLETWEENRAGRDYVVSTYGGICLQREFNKRFEA